MPPVVGILLGVILLLVLIFAIAYASGWAPRTAGPSGEELGAGVGPERKAQIAIAITLATGLLMLIYAMNEPNRQAEAYDRQKETSIERGEHFFAQYCYGCHGYNGQGAIVPGQGVMAARALAPLFRGERSLTQAAAEYRRNYDAQIAPCFRAASKISLPCKASRALLAVTISLPAESKSRIARRAQSMPPTTSIAT